VPSASQECLFRLGADIMNEAERVMSDDDLQSTTVNAWVYICNAQLEEPNQTSVSGITEA